MSTAQPGKFCPECQSTSTCRKACSLGGKKALPVALEWRGDALFLGALRLADVTPAGMMTAPHALITLAGAEPQKVSSCGSWHDTNCYARGRCVFLTLEALREAGVVLGGPR